MHLFAEPLCVPKAGSTQPECEDAFWPKRQIEGAGYTRFAIADGATETSFSRMWAKQLVRAYGHGSMDCESDLARCLAELTRRWTKVVHRKPLAWYAEEKVLLGTFAAFLGLTLYDAARPGEPGTWVSIASGDCCLVQLRGERVLAAFPLADSSAFNSRPILLSTNPDANAKALKQIARNQGAWESGDSFYLMTDALACWFFQARERSQSPWAILRDLNRDERTSFRGWIDEMRRTGEIKNDDVTLYRIDID